MKNFQYPVCYKNVKHIPVSFFVDTKTAIQQSDVIRHIVETQDFEIENTVFGFVAWTVQVYATERLIGVCVCDKNEFMQMYKNNSYIQFSEFIADNMKLIPASMYNFDNELNRPFPVLASSYQEMICVDNFDSITFSKLDASPSCVYIDEQHANATINAIDVALQDCVYSMESAETLHGKGNLIFRNYKFTKFFFQIHREMNELNQQLKNASDSFISRMTNETNESNAKEQYFHATRALYN